MVLRIYVFHSLGRWDTMHTLAVIAESEEQAKAIYVRRCGDYTEYKIETVEIKPGVCLVPGGYDAVWMLVVKHTQ